MDKRINLTQKMATENELELESLKKLVKQQAEELKLKDAQINSGSLNKTFIFEGKTLQFTVPKIRDSEGKELDSNKIAENPENYSELLKKLLQSTGSSFSILKTL